MGRGRQKAKHTKIARELKSYSPDVNYAALERELSGHGHDQDDPYAAWADYEPEGYAAEDEEEDEYEARQPKGA
ncbi:DUF3073 domain-containing protein [Gryllotalpicola ginsengisoli]|uniref:DUF3073 domain-containing protein n=1 Tax=Gryllotalpicola ginsengisoli TaxID=444608 RepID=UPI0003B397C8|nr:DUF3073 domain-containing protein [Gryllotalpicola ginsengisoli]